MTHNPYASPHVESHEPYAGSFWKYVALMVVTPFCSALLAGFVAGKLKQISPGVDSRHICLVMSWVWTIFSIPVAIAAWMRNHRAVAIIGLLIWTALSAYATLLTFAFWGS